MEWVAGLPQVTLISRMVFLPDVEAAQVASATLHRHMLVPSDVAGEICRLMAFVVVLSVVAVLLPLVSRV